MGKGTLRGDPIRNTLGCVGAQEPARCDQRRKGVSRQRRGAFSTAAGGAPATVAWGALPTAGEIVVAAAAEFLPTAAGVVAGDIECRDDNNLDNRGRKGLALMESKEGTGMRLGEYNKEGLASAVEAKIGSSRRT